MTNGVAVGVYLLMLRRVINVRGVNRHAGQYHGTMCHTERAAVPLKVHGIIIDTDRNCTDA